MIRRRQIATMVGALAVLRPGQAQTRRWHRLAIMMTASADGQVIEVAGRFWRAFFGELRSHGYEENRNLIVERWSRRGITEDYDRLSHEVIGSKPDVVYVASMRLVQALGRIGTDTPVVAAVANMIGAMDRSSWPMRNVTGLSLELPAQSWGDRLEMLREVAPGLSRIAILVPGTQRDDVGMTQVRAVARQLGVTLIEALLESPIQVTEYQRVVRGMGDQDVQGLIVWDAPENFMYRHSIVEAANTNRFPMVVPWREVAELGALMAYGMDLAEAGRRAARYVGRLLQGEKPADMAISRLDKLELVVNGRTARTLDLTVPPAVLARADEVIE